MFLKSNRSSDTTPSQDGGKLEDFRTLMISDEINSAVIGDRPKSILREKQLEDDDRPLDEERKSVRFDLEKEIDIKFTYSESEDDLESESEEQNPRISAALDNNVTLSSRRPTSPNLQYDNNDDSKNDYSNEKEDGRVDSEVDKRRLSLERIEFASRNAKIVGKRFLVQNVSENEHRSQMSRDSLEKDSSLDYLPSKFERVRNIDLLSKSETDCSVAKSSDSDEIRRTRLIVEQARRVAGNLSDRQLEDDESSDVSRLNQNYVVAKKERFVKPKLECSRSIDDMKVKMNREHEKEIEAFKIELEVKLQEKKKELEENFVQQKIALQQIWSQRLRDVKEEMARKEEQEIQALISEMDEARMENLKKVRAELEVCYEKERQEILSNLKTELDDRKRELLELRNQEMGKLENEFERDLSEVSKLNEYEVRKKHAEKIETLKIDLEKEFDNIRNKLRMQQRERITKFTEDHEQCLGDILRDFRMDESLARKMYKERLEEIRADFARDAEKEAKKQAERALQQESIDFEKMRCEKRLLQDKYTALKEKYMKLKNDVRLVVEKRNKRKEGYTTASETERSASTRTRTERTESSEQNCTPLRNVRSSPVTNAKSQDGQNTSEQVEEQSDPDNNSRSQKAAAGFQKPAGADAVGSKSTAKFESDDTTTASETNANMMMLKKRKSFTKRASSSAGRSNGSSNNNAENPVENIRKQLKKLEDIGDQLPSNETAYTVRYPFQDKAPANSSSELEFFRHRIHVERDSVRRAREALRQQKSAFQGRQRAWKQRSARATLEQLMQEERELSDMEVSLHRTRSLLGEKVIHLKHLEQSLERVANDKRNENDASSMKNDELTLSDMSSASSGFSSTDLGTDTFVDKPIDHYQESSEIIASLENLNSEIREIWDVLNKRQDNTSNIPPTPALMYSYLRWLRFHHLTAQPNTVQGAFGTPNIQSNILSQLTAAQPSTTATQNIIAQYGPNSGFTTSVGTVERSTSILMERTRNLRDWLRQARVESTTDLISPGQAIL